MIIWTVGSNLIVGGVLIPLGTYYFSDRQNIQDKQFPALNKNYQTLSYQAEDLPVDCIKGDMAVVRQDIRFLKASLDDLLVQHKAIGKIVSLNSYCLIHQLTSYVDEITTTSHPCHFPLLSKTQITELRNKTALSLNTDQKNQQGIWANFKINLFSPYLEQYTSHDCAPLKFSH